MDSTVHWSSLLSRVAVGLLLGAALVYLDNYAFSGETSPIVIVVCLLAATALAAAVWGARAWITALVAWALLPSAHAIKHTLGLPDTLQPNTYTSIVYLAAFTLAVTIVGSAIGLLVRRLRGKSSVAPPA